MEPTKDSIRHYEAGMAGFLSLILIALLTLEKLDTALKVAVIAIAMTLPFLIATILIKSDQKRYDKLEEEFKHFIYAFNGFGSFIALTAIFWHLLPIGGMLFVFMVFLCRFTIFRSTK